MADAPSSNLFGIPNQHNSIEAEIDPRTGKERPECFVTIPVLEALDIILQILSFGFAPRIDSRQEIGRLFPILVPVAGLEPVAIEGETFGLRPEDAHDFNHLPHVSFEDFPLSHYTHDLSVNLRPDITPDHRFTNLLGLHFTGVRDPCAAERSVLFALVNELRALEGLPPLTRDPHPIRPPKRIGDEPPPDPQPVDQGAIDEWHAAHDAQVAQLRRHLATAQCQPIHVSEPQDSIELEWETGLGARNVFNPCSAANVGGDSAGFFTAGHRRGDPIWNWPTIGDHIFAVGLWIWDRGHPPANTEIHPPRLMATRRHLPSLSLPRLSTRADIFANGDGDAFNNNQFPGKLTNPVRMSALDYTFAIDHPLPRPDGSTGLAWAIDPQKGDTFPIDPLITPFPDGTPERPLPHVVVTLPWRGEAVPDNAIFARTINVYWDGLASGVPPDFGIRVLKVTLDQLEIRRVQPTDSTARFLQEASVTTGAFRIFAEVGGQWMFLNDLFGVSEAIDPDTGETVTVGDVLSGGLGQSFPGDVWPIGQSFTIAVPPRGSFRVHAGGWQVQGIDGHFGHLKDPHLGCGAAGDAMNNELLNLGVLRKGGKDDPIGEVNNIYSEANRYGLGAHIEASLRQEGDFQNVFWNDNPIDAFRLHYRIDDVTKDHKW